ncbi:26011_t:CDS:2, partial [Racocetra persica]
NVESEVIVSYSNQNSHYDSLKNNLKRTILSSSENSNKEKGKEKPQSDINNHLKTIEEKYAKLNFSNSRKRKSNLLTSTSSKIQKPFESHLTFLDAVKQIKNTNLVSQDNTNNIEQ